MENKISRTIKKKTKKMVACIYRFCLPYIKAIVKEAKLGLIKSDPNIQLGQNVFISEDSKIETRYGGKIKIGNQTKIFDGVLILSDGGSVEIGNRCHIHPYSIIYGTESGTRIGSHVLIAGHCMIIPAKHNINDKSELIKYQGISSKGINVEDDVWISHGCTIPNGVTVGKGAVIAAGSVVCKSVPPYSVWGGVPAKYIKDR